MLESIENKRETKPSEAAVTVMFHGRSDVSGGVGSFCARESAAPSLSDLLTVFSAVVPGSSSLTANLRAPTKAHPSRNRTRSTSLSHTEKFSAEGLRAHSALAVSAANPNIRSSQAVPTVITPKTEQRRCFAA